MNDPWDKYGGRSQYAGNQQYQDARFFAQDDFNRSKTAKTSRFGNEAKRSKFQRMFNPERDAAIKRRDAEMKLPGYQDRMAHREARNQQIADQYKKVYGADATPEMIAAEQARQEKFFGDLVGTGLRSIDSGGQNYGPNNAPVYGKAHPDAPQNQVVPPAEPAQHVDPALEAWKAELMGQRQFQMGGDAYLRRFSMDPRRRMLLTRQMMYGRSPFGNPYGF